MAKALLTDGLLSTFPAADACPADLCMVGKLLTAPAFCLPVSAEKVSAAPVQKQGVVVQNVFHRDAVKGGELVRQFRREAAVKCAAFQILIEPFLHAHRYRNRRIGEFLKEMHLTEGRNTGFRKILNALEKNGSPKPIFETDPDRISFCTTLFIHPEFLRMTKNDNQKQTGENEQGENDNQSLKNENDSRKNDNQKQQEANDTIQITEREVSVLKYLEKEPFASREQIAMEFEVSKATVSRITAELKIKQLLERRGGSKKGRWIVKWTTES